MTSAKLEVRNLTKRFGATTVVEDLCFSVDEGELFCLLGPSGCGKSTTLRMIAGLVAPSEGAVLFDGDAVTDEPPYRRDSSMVFQSWALFQHRSVRENVEFGLKMDGVGAEERKRIALEWLDLVDLADHADKAVTALSGGQKQRVALARSLAIEPDILLLDEPLSNLDKRLRESLQLEIKTLQEELEKTMIYVTHNQHEAFSLADRIAIMEDGDLAQVGTPDELNSDPQSVFIEEFLGDTNFYTAIASPASNGSISLETDLGIDMRFPPTSVIDGRETIMCSIRPDSIVVDDGSRAVGTPDQDPPGRDSSDREDSPISSEQYAISGVVEDRRIYPGSLVQYDVDVNGQLLTVDSHDRDGSSIARGDTIHLAFDQKDVFVFGADGSRLRFETSTKDRSSNLQWT